MLKNVLGSGNFAQKMEKVSKIIAILNLVNAALNVFLQGYYRLHPPINNEQSGQDSTGGAGGAGSSTGDVNNNV